MFFYTNVEALPPVPYQQQAVYFFPIIDCKIAAEFERKGWELRLEDNPRNSAVVSKHLAEAKAAQA